MTAIKEKPLTKTEIRILKKMRDYKRLPYGVEPSLRLVSGTKTIEKLIARGLARCAWSSKYGDAKDAEITPEGRKALEDAS